MPGFHATEGCDPFEDVDLEADRGQDPLDDAAVLGREAPRGQEAPAGERQHDPREQGEGQEELMAQAEGWHRAVSSGERSYKPSARDTPGGPPRERSMYRWVSGARQSVVHQTVTISRRRLTKHGTPRPCRPGRRGERPARPSFRASGR